MSPSKPSSVPGPSDKEEAHEAVVALADLFAMFDDTARLLADETKPAPVHELKALLRNLQQMTSLPLNRSTWRCSPASEPAASAWKPWPR